jgi:hypothetical protein
VLKIEKRRSENERKKACEGRKRNEKKLVEESASFFKFGT